MTTPRTTKTPAQRATEAVGVLERRLKKLREKAADLDDQAKAVGTEITDVEKRLAYARANPDLPPPTSPAPTTTGGSPR